MKIFCFQSSFLDWKLKEKSKYCQTWYIYPSLILSVWKWMKALLVDEMKSGGSKSPQYFPMRGEALESPLYNIK